MNILKRWIFLMLVAALAACGNSSPTGKWITTKDYDKTVEFFDDGTVNVPDGKRMLSGTWTKTDDGRIRIALGGSEFGMSLGQMLRFDERNADILLPAGSDESLLRGEFIRWDENDAELYKYLNATMKRGIAEGLCLQQARLAIAHNSSFGRSYIIAAECVRNDHVKKLEFYDQAVGKNWNETDQWEARINNDRAWFLATTDNEALHDPSKALSLATDAVALNEGCSYLDTRAAAHAALGDFTSALADIDKALARDECNMKKNALDKRRKMFTNKEVPITHSRTVIKQNLKRLDKLIVGSWLSSNGKATCTFNSNGTYIFDAYGCDGSVATRGTWYVKGEHVHLTRQAELIVRSWKKLNAKAEPFRAHSIHDDALTMEFTRWRKRGDREVKSFTRVAQKK